MLKGQVSIETLTLVIAFFTTVLPVVFILLSQTSIQSEPIKQSQVDAAVALLKNNIETVYSGCPTQKTILLNLPDTARTITMFQNPATSAPYLSPYLVVESKGAGYVINLNIKPKMSNSYIYANGNVTGTGRHLVNISCIFTLAGHPELSIATYEGGAVS
jgi:hypothetical protein